MENKSAQVNRIVQCAESLESGNINIYEFVSFLGEKNSSVLCIPDDKIQIITQAITRIEAGNCSKKVRYWRKSHELFLIIRYFRVCEIVEQVQMR